MNRNRDEYKARLRAGRASLRIGKRIGSGASHVGGRGLDAVGKADASLMQADTADTSRIGTASRDLAFRAGRAGVKGITSSSRFMWRHRKAPVKAAKATAGGARATVRAARALAVHAELGRSVDGRPGRTARQGPEHVTEPEYRNTDKPTYRNRYDGIPVSRSHYRAKSPPRLRRCGLLSACFGFIVPRTMPTRKPCVAPSQSATLAGAYRNRYAPTNALLRRIRVSCAPGRIAPGTD